MMTLRQALCELFADFCWCGAWKGGGAAFCMQCSRVLPPTQATELRITPTNSELYAVAFDKAKRCAQTRRLTAKQVGAGRHTRPR